MTDAEALGLIGTLLMRTMGVSLVIADSIPMGEQQRDYIARQREWYEQQQNLFEIDSLIVEVTKEVRDVTSKQP